MRLTVAEPAFGLWPSPTSPRYEDCRARSALPAGLRAEVEWQSLSGETRKSRLGTSSSASLVAPYCPDGTLPACHPIFCSFSVAELGSSAPSTCPNSNRKWHTSVPFPGCPAWVRETEPRAS